MKYFALCDDQEIVPMGEFESALDAFENEVPNTIWLFSEDTLRDLLHNIEEVLNESQSK